LNDWVLKYTQEAINDLDDLDHTQVLQVKKAINKTLVNPLPKSEGGYGKPLGNHSKTKLAGYSKIVLMDLGLRVVYKAVKTDKTMIIIVVSVRSDEEVYKLAQARIKE
jgi:mRNA interferase RelE/StbE